MKVPFHLRRRPGAGPASAVFLETDGVPALLDLAARLGPGGSPTIHRVTGGFLVRLGAESRAPSGAVRLRGLAANLYVPVDADLVPDLLDDEAAGLTRDAGLVFLPTGRILGFDPRAPLAFSDLVGAGAHEGRAWSPFPERPARVERLREIRLEPPAGAPSDAFGADADPTATGPGRGDEGPPRPVEAGAATTRAARAALGAGRGLIRLGSLLGIKALVDLGARWVDRAADRVPRLTGAILGRQEGALRELLRQFRAGEIERALRHALPLGQSGGRGGVAATDPRLPEMDPDYSLRSLLGPDRGRGGIWLGGVDVQAELAREYRKAAEEAERRGDFRRAAYIHGRLLDDYATAARLLGRGGLHRDAAIVHLDRLGDVPAAARSFEAAGESDRALRLYRDGGLRAEAGDLLRRLGEDEEAEAEYRLAADGLASGSGSGFLAAGDLLRDRARRPDLALGYYARGWVLRPSANAVTCALRMAAVFADAGDVEALLGVVDQADELFRRPGQEAPAGEFYNELARLADREAMAGGRADVRDRALMGLAAKLRQAASTQARPGNLASALLGRPKAWPVDVVGDAKLAIQALADRAAAGGRPPAAGSRRIEVDRGKITAACHAPAGGFVFLGLASGEVLRVDIARGQVDVVHRGPSPVGSIAADAEGRTFAVLAGVGPARSLARIPASPSAFFDTLTLRIHASADAWLTPFLAGDPGAVGVWDGEVLTVFDGPAGFAMAGARRVTFPFLKTIPDAALLLATRAGTPGRGWSVLIHDGVDICHADSLGKRLRALYLGWRPSLPAGHRFRSVPLSWLNLDGERIELAGLDAEGNVRWTALNVTDAELIRASNDTWAGGPPFAAAALVRPGLVAAVRPTGVTWVRRGPRSCAPVGSTELALSAPLACFPAPRTDELVVVCGDGSLTCVPTPR